MMKTTVAFLLAQLLGVTSLHLQISGHPHHAENLRTSPDSDSEAYDEVVRNLQEQEKATADPTADDIETTLGDLAQGDDIRRPRMLAMRGCSGSSAVSVFARALLRLHGIPTPEGGNPMRDENGDVQVPPEWKGWPAELLKPETNWYAKDSKDMGEAMLKMNDLAESYNKTLFFKGMSQYMLGDKSKNDEWADLLPAFRKLNMYGVIAKRQNLLDVVVCQIKDCFQASYGYPVDAKTGKQSDACFSRRGDIHSNPTAIKEGDVELVAKRKHKSHGYLFEPDSEEEEEVKAYVRPNMIKLAIDREHEFTKMARHNLNKQLELNASVIYEEDLLDFQAPYDDGLKRAVPAWAMALESWGVTPDPHLIKTFLKQYQNTYHVQPPHSEVIDNIDEVIEALSDTFYAKFIRE